MDDYVELPFELDGRPPLTIEAWVLPETPLRNRGLVAGSGRVLVEFARMEGLSNFVWQNTLLSPSSQADIWYHSWAYMPGDDNWIGKRVHVAGVFDQGEVRFYLNGRFALERGWYERRDLTEARKQSALPSVRIGGSPPDGPFFHGRIEEVRISKTIPYANDFSPTENFESDEQTIGLYRFEEGQGTKLADSSGHDHHGTIYGAKWVKDATEHIVP